MEYGTAGSNVSRDLRSSRQFPNLKGTSPGSTPIALNPLFIGSMSYPSKKRVRRPRRAVLPCHGPPRHAGLAGSCRSTGIGPPGSGFGPAGLGRPRRVGFGDAHAPASCPMLPDVAEPATHHVRTRVVINGILRRGSHEPVPGAPTRSRIERLGGSVVLCSMPPARARHP